LSLILTPRELQKLNSEKKEENIHLSNKIKQMTSAKADCLIHESASKFIEKIDCKQCANCCKKVFVGVTLSEIKNLSNLKGESTETFKDKYVDMELEDEGGYLKHSPCQFLKGSLCSIYANRPHSCSEYPHLLNPGMKYRFKRVLDEYSICPIVYHTVEELKLKLDPVN